MLTNLKKWVQNASVLLPPDSTGELQQSNESNRLNTKRLTIGGGDGSNSSNRLSGQQRASSFSATHTVDLISSTVSNVTRVLHSAKATNDNISNRSSISLNVEDSTSSSSSDSSCSSSNDMDLNQQQATTMTMTSTSSRNRKLSEIPVEPPVTASLAVKANRSLSSTNFTTTTERKSHHSSPRTTYHQHRHSSTLSPTSLSVNHNHQRKVSLQIPADRSSQHHQTIYKRTLEQYSSKRKSCSSLSKSEIDCTFCFICNSSILTYCSTTSLNSSSTYTVSGGRSICSHCTRSVCNECSIVSLINQADKKYGLLCKPCCKSQQQAEESTGRVDDNNEIINIDEEETSEAVSDKQLLVVANNNTTSRVISAASHASIVSDESQNNRLVIRNLLQQFSSTTNRRQRRQSLDEQAMKARMAARESRCSTVTTINNNNRNSFAINNNNYSTDNRSNNINGIIEIYTTSYDISCDDDDTQAANDSSSPHISFYPNSSRVNTPKTKRRLPTTPSESQLANNSPGSPTTTTTSAQHSPHSSSRSTPFSGSIVHDQSSALIVSSTTQNANEIFIKLNEQLENLNENIKNQISPPLRLSSSTSSSSAVVPNEYDDINITNKNNKLEHHRSHEHVAEWLNSNSLLASPPPSSSHPLHKHRQNSEYSTSSTASDFLNIPGDNMSKQNRSNSVSTDEPLIEINLSRQFYIKRNSQMSLENNKSEGVVEPQQHHKLQNKTKSQSRILTHHHLKKDDTRNSLPLNEITDDIDQETCDKENVVFGLEDSSFRNESPKNHDQPVTETIQRILVYKNPKELSLESNEEIDLEQPSGFNRTRRRPSSGLGIEISARQKLPDLDPEKHGLGAVVAAVQPDGLMGQYSVDIKEGDEILEINGVTLRNKNDDQIESIIDSSAQSHQGEIELVVRRSSLTNLSTTSSSCSSSIITNVTSASSNTKSLNQIEENGEFGSSFEENDVVDNKGLATASNKSSKTSHNRTLRRMHEIDSGVLSGEGRGFREISIKRKNHSGFNGNSKRDTLFSDPALLFAELKHYKNMMNKQTGAPSVSQQQDNKEESHKKSSNESYDSHRYDLPKQYSDVGHSTPSSPPHFFQNSLDESRYAESEINVNKSTSVSIKPTPNQMASRKSINLSNYRSTSPFKPDSIDTAGKKSLKSMDSSNTLLDIPRPSANIQRRNSSSTESGYDTRTNSSLRVNESDDLRRKLSIGSKIKPSTQSMTSSRSVNNQSLNHSPSSSMSKDETIDLSSSTYSFTSQSDQASSQQQQTTRVNFLNVMTEQITLSSPKMVKEDSMINIDNSVSPFGDLMLQLIHKEEDQQLIVKVIKARNLIAKDANGFSDPFVKVYLLPGRDQENKRRTKYVSKNLNPEWNSTLTYANVYKEELKNKTLEFTLWDWDRFKSNDFLGMVKIELNDCKYLDDKPRWFKLRNNFYTQDENGNISPNNKTTSASATSGGGESSKPSMQNGSSFRKSLRRNKDKQ